MAFDLTNGSHFQSEVFKRNRNMDEDSEYRDAHYPPSFRDLIHFRKFDRHFSDKYNSQLTAPPDLALEQFLFCNVCGKTLKGLEHPAGLCLKCQRGVELHRSAVYRIFFRKEGLWARNLIETRSPLFLGRNEILLR